jgi:hypothetical protein
MYVFNAFVGAFSEIANYTIARKRRCSGHLKEKKRNSIKQLRFKDKLQQEILDDIKIRVIPEKFFCP